MQSFGGPVDAGDLGCMAMGVGEGGGEDVGVREVVFGEDVIEDVGSFSVVFEEGVTEDVGSTELESGESTLSELLGVAIVVVIVRAIRVVW